MLESVVGDVRDYVGAYYDEQECYAYGKGSEACWEDVFEEDLHV